MRQNVLLLRQQDTRAWSDPAMMHHGLLLSGCAILAALAAAAVQAGAPAQDAAQTLSRARAARQSGKLDAARALFAQACAEAGLAPRERDSARLELGDVLWEGNDMAAARAEYAKLLEGDTAPPQLRGLALLRTAQTCQRQGDYPAARSAYEKLAALAGAAPHHVWEARRGLRELERLVPEGAGEKRPIPERALPRPSLSHGERGNNGAATAKRGQATALQSGVAPPKLTGQAVELHVALGGNDAGDGTAAHPFATVEKARDAIRALKAKGALPRGGVAVVIRGGDYQVRRTLKLSKEDSGAAQAPIVYRAAAGETVRFYGGAKVKDFEVVRDEAVLAKLPPEARGKVLRADLKAQGLSEYGTYDPGGFGSGGGFNTRPLLEVFFNGRPLQLARWPNDGYVRIANINDQAPTKTRGAPGSKKGQFYYEGDRPARWKDESDLWLYGYFFHDWADSYEKVEALDLAKRLLTLREPAHRYGFRKGQRYYAINALAELDQPGEWHLDRSSGMLYLYPPASIADALVEISLFDAPVLELEGAEHVIFRGLVWDLGRADAVHIKDGAQCLLAGCAIRRFAGNGVVIQGGAGHGLLGCDLELLGRGGTAISGGDRKTLTPGGHFVENCHIHDFSRIDHTYTPAVLLNGAGNRITHNLFHRSYSSAMRIEGNDHLIECNEVHSVLLESDDQGGVDMWGNPTYRGNVYRWNYWHHIGNGLGCGQAGIRLDDAICGTAIYGNIFYRCSDGGFGGVQIHGGKDNWVDNNVFVQCKFAVSFSPWGRSRWEDWLAKACAGKLKEVNYDQPPYATRYPELAKLKEQPDINHLWGNIALGCGKLFNRDVPDQDAVANAMLDDKQLGSQGVLPLKDLGPVLARLPLRPIPFEEIGLYQDELRHALPRVAPIMPRAAGKPAARSE